MKKIFPAVMILIVTIQIFLPVILKPAAAADIIFHGGLGISMIVIPACLGGVLWIRRKGQSIEDPDQRNELTSALLLKGGAALLIIGFALFSVNQLRTGQSLAAIQRHGQRADAKVLDIYEDSCDKHGCSVSAKYQFTPAQGAGSQQSVIGYAYLAGNSDRHNPRLIHAETSHSIPVAYDINDPSNSTANFDDIAFSRDPMANSVRGIEFMGAMAAFGFALLWGIIRSTRKKVSPRPAHG